MEGLVVAVVVEGLFEVATETERVITKATAAGVPR